MWWEGKTLKTALTLALLCVVTAGGRVFGQHAGTDYPDFPPEEPCQTYNFVDGSTHKLILANEIGGLNGGNRCILNVSSPSSCLDLTFNCTDFSFSEDSLIVPWHPVPSPTPMGLRLQVYKRNPGSSSADFELPFFIQEQELGYLVTTVPENAQTTFRLNTGTYVIEYTGIETDTGFCAKRSELELTIEAVNPFPTPKDTLRGTSQGNNMVETFISKDESGTSGVTERTYYDDYGREEQTVGIGITPDGSDLVSMSEYDPFGRKARSWIPAAVQENNGKYVPLSAFSPLARQTDMAPYERFAYEDSPLSRPVLHVGAGNAWHLSERGEKISYYANVAGNDSLHCRLVKVTRAVDTNVTLAVNGEYPTGSLKVTRTSDADGRVVFEFKDKQERTVLQRKMYRNGNARNWLDTYYVYDDFGRLCGVLPPAAVEYIMTGTVSHALLNDYAYLYSYDHRHRMTAKKTPGCDWVQYCYDEADLPVFIQDGNMRMNGEMAFVLYDDFGRETVRGTCEAGNMSSLRTRLSGKYARTQFDEYEGSYSLPTNIPLYGARIHQMLYYDDYRFAESLGFPMPEQGNYSHHCPNPQGDGLLTGSAVAVLDGSGNSLMLRSRTIYDELTRLPVQSVAENRFGGLDIVHTTYDYMGNPVLVEKSHGRSSGTIHTEQFAYTYDHAGRLLTTTYSLNGGTPVTLAANTYDDVGRLQRVERAGNPLLTTQYAYNLRSWTTEISSPLFSQQLYYNQSHHGSTPQWGGNISSMDWEAVQGTGSDRQRGYSFSYDALSRLTQANYYEDGSRSGHYDTQYAYDLMGNILSLQRNGLHDDGEFGPIDDLAFEYDGNRITKVADYVSDGPYRKDAWHYRDDSNRETEREYDDNGNLVKDSDAKISSIQYNLLNLPRMIKFSDGGKHVYTYDAGGRKLRAEYHTPVMVAAEPQVLVDEQLLLPMGLDTFEDEPQEAQPEELSVAEWEMQWDEFAAQTTPFICIMPPQPPDDEIFIEQPMPDDQLIENEVPCDVTATDYCGNSFCRNSLTLPEMSKFDKVKFG